jgi:hypothetical protein
MATTKAGDNSKNTLRRQLQLKREIELNVTTEGWKQEEKHLVIDNSDWRRKRN